MIYALSLVIIAVLLLFMLTNSLQENDSYGSILSALLTIGTAFVGIVIFLRRADPPIQLEQEASALALELLGQWDPEIRHRRQRFGDSRTIPLCWASAGHNPAVVVGKSAALGTVRLKLEGRLENNPDRATSQLADLFDRLPTKRLVVLGEPGSGKTFLGISLAVGLLHRRVAGTRVPVFLQLSSWDPVSDSLDEWIVRSLASAHYGGRERIPRALLTARLILPVLDGLDELPEHLRRRAISRVNDTLDGDRPLVLTCRSTEYKDLLTGGAPTLSRAPVVRVLPVSIADIVAHLAGHPPWTGVVKHVEERPDGPLATALATPLMLSLFVAAYRDRDATDLLSDRFTSRHAVEDHLVDLLLDTVYPPDGERDSRAWTAQQARTWLTYLAQYLHRHEERDLAWWQLAQRTMSPWMAPALGLAVGFTTFWLADAVSSNPDLFYYGSDPDPVSGVLDSPALLGTIFGVVVTSLWLVGERRTRGRTLLITDRGNKGFGRGMLTGSLLVLTPGIPLLLAGSVEPPPDYGYVRPDYVIVAQTSALAGALLALSVVAGLAVALHELLVARSVRIDQASPEAFLRQDRRSALSAAAATGLVVGALSGLATTLAAALGGHVGERIALALDMPTVAKVDMPPLDTHVPWLYPPVNMPRLITASILLMVLFALAVLATRAWPRFLVARTSLAVSGNLPWRLMSFLADARDRGLLRGSGGSYQFWHVRLQERLVATAPAGKPIEGRRRHWRLVAAGLTVAVLALMVAATGSAEPADCRPTGWAGVDSQISRVVINDNSACFAALDEDEWHELRVGRRDRPTLDKIKAAMPVEVTQDNEIYIVGALDRVSQSRWHSTLQGVAAAQDINDSSLAVYLIRADAEYRSTHDVDLNPLTALYLDTYKEQPTGAVNIDTKSSYINLSKGAIFIGLPAMDFHKLAAEYVDSKIDDWLKFPRTTGSGPGPYASIDDFNDQACSALTENTYTWTLDMRSVTLTKEEIDHLADCGPMEILVDENQVEELRALQPKPSMIGFVHVEDKSHTIVDDCDRKLGKQADADSFAVCLGVLAGATGFRTDLMPVVPED